MPKKPLAKERKMRLLSDVNGFDEWAEAVVSQLEGRLDRSSSKPEPVDDRRADRPIPNGSRPSEA